MSWLDAFTCIGHSAIGTIELWRRHYPKALYHYERAVALNPQEPVYIFRRGYCRLLEKQYREAIEDFDRVLELFPRFAEVGNPRLYFKRGLAYLELKNYHAARHDFNLEIKRNPKDPESFYYLALVAWRLEYTEVAIGNLAVAKKLALKWPQNKRTLGYLEALQKEMENGNRS
jgi:tetratricopeptide (TPR) repeat protein